MSEHTSTTDQAEVWTFERLLAAEAAEERLKLMTFWSHDPRGRTVPGPFVFSQWYEHPVRVDGVVYPTAEHHMMASKARLFGDEGALSQILQAPSPGAAKALGRTVRGFDEAVWSAERETIVTDVSTAKFSSDPMLRDYLVSTRDRVLVEASPTDRIWGVGMAADHPDIDKPSRWRGLNLLGFALMRARHQLTEAVD